jgi:hypothetical protein
LRSQAQPVLFFFVRPKAAGHLYDSLIQGKHLQPLRAAARTAFSERSACSIALARRSSGMNAQSATILHQNSAKMTPVPDNVQIPKFQSQIFQIFFLQRLQQLADKNM